MHGSENARKGRDGRKPRRIELSDPLAGCKSSTEVNYALLWR